MNHDSILHLLGLARKAGRLEVGEEPVGAAARAQQARVILLASDAAANTARRAAHFGQTGGVLWLPLPFTKAELGGLMGRESCAMLAVTDVGFAAVLAEKLAAQDAQKYGAAAVQLREKADRVLQRQREQRRHEKNLKRGKRKPWAPPPKLEEPPSQKKRGRPPEKTPSQPGASRSGATPRPAGGTAQAGGPARFPAGRNSGRPGKSQRTPGGAAHKGGPRPPVKKTGEQKTYAPHAQLHKSGPGGKRLTAKPASGGSRPAGKP